MSSQEDIVGINFAPETEQRICIECGFCCDGTLFRTASLIPGERGSLPELIEASSFEEGGKEYFRLPCRYFAGRCTIYREKKAHICSAFRCRLLNSLADGEVSPEEALRIVAEAKLLRDEATGMFKVLTGKNGRIPFREVLAGLNSIRTADDEGGIKTSEVEMLVVRCNILEALLIKHFRTTEDFEKLIMK
mgnify:CR=1 FL=1